MPNRNAEDSAGYRATTVRAMGHNSDSWGPLAPCRQERCCRHSSIESMHPAAASMLERPHSKRPQGQQPAGHLLFHGFSAWPSPLEGTVLSDESHKVHFVGSPSSAANRMKRLVPMWGRRRRSTRMLVSRVDRPRVIDRVIDYFGERLAPVMVPVRSRRKA